MTIVSGKNCPRCGASARYQSNGGCVACLGAAAKRRAAGPLHLLVDFGTADLGEVRHVLSDSGWALSPAEFGRWRIDPPTGTTLRRALEMKDDLDRAFAPPSIQIVGAPPLEPYRRTRQRFTADFWIVTPPKEGAMAATCAAAWGWVVLAGPYQGARSSAGVRVRTPLDQRLDELERPVEAMGWSLRRQFTPRN